MILGLIIYYIIITIFIILGPIIHKPLGLTILILIILSLLYLLY
jgi:hypothetical protein